MCIAVPGRIEEINGDEAVVNYGGIKFTTNIMFIKEPNVGDYVLIHAGCAVEKLDEKEAEETIQIFKELAEVIEKR